MSYVVCPHFKNNISSETTGRNLMKLGWDVPWVDLYQSCSKNYDISKNMAARGGASFPYMAI